jgi:hypothetical protein
VSLLGVRLTLLIGPTVALPAPPPLIQAVHEVEVTHRDDGQSGFSVTFNIGRAGPSALMDYALASNPLLRPFNRVIVMVTFNATPHVLIDGIISRQELAQGTEPGTSTLTIKGEDVSVMMDREERSEEHPAQNEMLIAAKLILSYAQYGLIPVVIPPMSFDVPLPIERIPVQQGTDLEYLRKLAEVHGHVFYVAPGSVPFTNYAYWGPPIRVGLPQRAITVNMGPETNAKLDEAAKDGLGTASVDGQVQDAQTGQKVPVRTFGSLRPPLASMPSWLVDGQNARKQKLRASGANAVQAMAQAQGAMEATTDVVKLEGELDAGSYGGVLQARALVGVRGAGFSYDGFYYVRRVTHKIAVGRYTQKFELVREGLGSTTPMVPV